jgi:hypothetical protein
MWIILRSFNDNLFQIFFIVKDCCVCTIIDGGSCNNLVSADFVIKIGLTARAHTHPYHIHWLSNSGKAKITDTARIHFSIGTYHDSTDCDVVPMQACSLLLGHPWEFDTDVVHHGRSNKYTLAHKGKKITLLPLTPNEIVQCDKVIAQSTKRESENQHDQTAPPSSSNAIKLKSCAMLATRSDIFVPSTIDVPFHALVCRQVLFLLDILTAPLPRTITNLLQEFKDVFAAKIPSGLPPLRGIEHQIDLIPGATLPNHAAYRTNPKRLRESNDKSKSFWTTGMYEKALVLASFLLFWFLRKMIFGASVLIVEPLTILPLAIIFLYQG